MNRYKPLTTALYVYALLIPVMGYSQGWVADINLQFNHDHYAYEKISMATFTYSGFTATGSSQTGKLQLIINGNGEITGDMNLSISGIAYEPYNTDHPYSEPMTAAFTGNFRELCSTGFFEQAGDSPLQQVYIWIVIYPRLEITSFLNECDHLLFTSAICSPVYIWEVGESISGSFKVISGKSSATISIRRDELDAMGFADPFGRKYFRVRGVPGTMSQIQPVDIFYPPATASLTSTPPKCNDGNDGSVLVNITSSDPSIINDFVLTLFEDAALQQPVQQEYLNDEVTLTFANLDAGTYWVKVENNTNTALHGNCANVYAADELVNPAPVSVPSFEISDYNGYQVRCYSGRDGTIKVNVSGGTGVYTSYEWSPEVSDTDMAANLSEGTYQIRVGDSNGCWSPTYSQTLLAPEELSLELLSTGGRNGYDVTCRDRSDGVIQTHVSGGMPQYVYAWSTGSAENVLNGVGTGSYELTVTDANGCRVTEGLTLVSPEPISFDMVQLAGINCPGDQSGSFEVQSPLNTIGEIVYAWSTGETTKKIAGKGAGPYSVTVSDSQGCMATRYDTLVEPLPFGVDIAATSDYHGSFIRCNGEANGQLAALVSDSDGNLITADLYTWYRNDVLVASGTALSSLGGLKEGLYRAVATYRGTCKTQSDFMLEDPAAVTATITTISDYNGVPISCHGHADGSISASANGGTGEVYTYLWSNGETTPVLTDLAAGTYTVTAMDINGCKGNAKKNLRQPDTIRALISVLSDYNGQPISCAGSSDAWLKVSATGGVPSYTYRWSQGPTTDELRSVPSGLYSVTVMDANGCEGVADTTITDPSPVQASIFARSDYNGYGVSCKGKQDGFLSAKGSGGTGGFEYFWGNSPSDSLYANLAAGVYTVVVRDRNNCTDTAQGVITEPASLILNTASVKTISCNQGNDGEIALLATGGAGSFEYSLYGDGWQEEPFIKGLKAGHYELHARDANFCRASKVVALTEPAAPLAIMFMNVEPATCGDPKGKVSALVTGGTGDYQYEWTDSQEQVISNLADLVGLSPGIFTLRVLDANLCEETQSVGISSTDGPKAIISDVVAVTCFNAGDGAAMVEIISGEGPFAILWNDGQVSARASNLDEGKHIVQITDANGCATVETADISGPDSLQIRLVDKKEPACHGGCDGKLTVVAKGGNEDYHYEWESSSGPEAANLCAGEYTVSVSDAKGCTVEKTFVLVQPPPVSLKVVTAQSPGCPGVCNGVLEIIASGGTGPLRYSWSGGATGPRSADLCAGSYEVVVADSLGCQVSELFTLQDPSPIVLNLGDSVTLCSGQTHTLEAGAQWKKISWSSTTGLRSSAEKITIAEAGTYWLEVLTRDGCIARDTFFLATSDQLLNANFLMTSAATKEDTIVIIDVSWPLPESIVWTLPPEMNRLHDDGGDIVYGKIDKPGQYQVSLTAMLGGCLDKTSKFITILDRANTEAGRRVEEPFLKKFELYPNPNGGRFDVEVEFREESIMVLTVVNVLTSRKVIRIMDSGKKYYLTNMNLSPIGAGPYALRLDYNGGTKYIRFIVE